jgi:hypothetical protein
MNSEAMYDKILASFATGVRGDFSIADFERLDDRSAHVLLEYNPRMGRPTGNQIESYFQKIFEGKVQILPDFQVKPNAVSVVAQLVVPTRPMDDAADKGKMTPVIAGLMYLDNKLQNYWEVKEKDGHKLLAKTSEENIEQIIAARRNRTFITKSSAISLASVGAAKGLLGKGDVVFAYCRDEIKPFEITEKVQGGFRGKFEGQEKETVIAKEAALDLKGLAGEKPKDETAMLVKYFSEAYGDKGYAAELVKKK